MIAPRLGALLLLLIFWLPSPSRADAPARLVVDLDGRDQAVVLSQVRGVLGEDFQAEVLALDEVLDAGVGPWVVTGPAGLQPCAAEATTTVQIQTDLAEAERLIEELEFHAARDLLVGLEAGACGSTDPLTPATWSRVPFLLGLVHFYIGDKDSAREAFRQAGERQPGMEWDTRFAPEPQQTFLLGLNDAVRSHRAQLQPPADGGAVFLVDGIPLATGGAPVELIGDAHVLQRSAADGSNAGAVLSLTGAGEVQLRDLPGLTAELAEGPAADPGAAAFASLAAAAQARGFAEVLLLTEASGAGAWWFNAIDGRWKPASLDVADKLAAAQRHKAAGGVLIGVGVATAIGGAALGLGQLAQTTALEQQMSTSATLYDMLLPEYQEHQAAAIVGFGVLAAGGVTVLAGIASANRGARLEREAGSPAQVGVLITPTGFGIAGRF